MMTYWLDQSVQLLGALLILVGYACTQLGVMHAKSIPYLLLNFAGGVLLGLSALNQFNWGFVLLEGTWAALSLWSLITTVRAANKGAKP